MAFVQDEDGFTPRLNYNIDFPIGPGRFNKKDDVALVQKLLRYIYVETEYFPRHGFPLPRGTPDIVVDGKFGPTTSKYILHYKQALRARNVSVFPDAVILPFGPDKDQRSVVTKTYYTMRHLLGSARLADDEAPVKSLEDLPFNPDIPAELRSSLRVSKRRAAGFEEGT